MKPQGMNINSNFIIERIDNRMWFLSNKENGKGYYVSNVDFDDLNRLLNDKPQKLIDIGFLTDRNNIVRESIFNTLFSTIHIDENVLLPILYALFILFFSTNASLLVFKGGWFLIPSGTWGTVWVSFAIIFLGIVFIHESSHIVVARLVDIGVIRIGFKLKYKFIPMVYVKIQPTARDRARACTALAGNIADQFLIMLYYCLFVAFNADVFQYALFFQILITFGNLNIFFPTDASIFLFSILGIANFASNSVDYTKKWILRKARKDESIFAHKKISFLFYGTMRFLLIGLYFTAIVLMVLRVCRVAFY